MKVTPTQIVLSAIDCFFDLKNITQEDTKGALSAKINVSLVENSEDAHKYMCELDINFTTETNLFKLGVMYSGIFNVQDFVGKKLSKEDQQELMTTCAKHMYPYLRETVADISRRLPLATPINLELLLPEAYISAGDVKKDTPQGAAPTVRQVKKTKPTSKKSKK